MKTNTKAKDYRKDTSERTAGGFGVYAAVQNAEALLRRAVMGCLLWEDLAYEDGQSVAKNIANLIPQVDPDVVAGIAVEARHKQKLRHVPLFIAREMLRHETHKKLVARVLNQIILRADELTEFVALYWKDKRQPLAAQAKKGLARAFCRFNAYHLAKYDRNTTVKLRDVLFLCHPKPANQEQAESWKKLVDGTLEPPDTWEVALSAGKDKKATWTRLIEEKKLGALAFMRNLRNMEQAGVDEAVITKGFKTINPGWLLPVNFYQAAKAAPRWEREIETLMLEMLAKTEPLPGYTIFVVDVSGSMGAGISGRSTADRLSVASIMAMQVADTCERVSIYATAGNDGRRVHATQLLRPRHGFAVVDEIAQAQYHLGGGGIFTRQCLEYIKSQERTQPDRIIIFSDSQDCDWSDSPAPKPFGKKNYIVDVSAHKRGIAYDGIWDAEISGWSEHFLEYIRAYEGLEVNLQESD